MRVTGTTGNGNPSPSSFAGSPEGTNVTLNVGDYTVTEGFEDSASSPLKVVRTSVQTAAAASKRPVKAGSATSQTSLW